MRARIIQEDRSTTQSGKAHAGQWRLEFDAPSGVRHDPLTGWLGSGETQAQIRLTFPTLEAAQDYARRKGLEVDIRPAPQRPLRIQAYADNFR
ncbi:MAG: ETC complex I subunit [Alphaproteobacteria bacterium]|nr:ETC complex I subunit [Alphaproteobacteria bacterium]